MDSGATEAGMVPGLWGGCGVCRRGGGAAGRLAGGLWRSWPEGAVDKAGGEGDEDCSGDGADDADHVAADEVAVRVDVCFLSVEGAADERSSEAGGNACGC